MILNDYGANWLSVDRWAIRFEDNRGHRYAALLLIRWQYLGGYDGDIADCRIEWPGGQFFKAFGVCLCDGEDAPFTIARAELEHRAEAIRAARSALRGVR